MQYNLFNRFISLFSLAAALIIFLPSCQTMDPEYKFAMSRVSNAEIPPQKIVGDWIMIRIFPWGEDKDSYKFLSNGTGLQRSSSKFNNGTGCVIEQNLTWSYTGANKWYVKKGPPRLISGSCDYGLRIREPFTVRFHQNSLLNSYECVLVPMDSDERVKAKLQQMRAEAIRQGT